MEMLRSCSSSPSWSEGLGGGGVDRKRKMECEAVGWKVRGRFSSKGGAEISSSTRKRKQMVLEKDDDDWKRARKSSC